MRGAVLSKRCVQVRLERPVRTRRRRCYQWDTVGFGKCSLPDVGSRARSLWYREVAQDTIRIILRSTAEMNNLITTELVTQVMNDSTLAADRVLADMASSWRVFHFRLTACVPRLFSRGQFGRSRRLLRTMH